MSDLTKGGLTPNPDKFAHYTLSNNVKFHDPYPPPLSNSLEVSVLTKGGPYTLYLFGLHSPFTVKVFISKNRTRGHHELHHDLQCSEYFQRHGEGGRM